MKKSFLTKILTLLLALVLVVPVSIGNVAEVQADETEETATSGTCGDNAAWVFDESTGTLTISGSGATNYYSAGTTPWYSYCGTIKKVVVDSGITALGTYVFQNCTALEEVSLPDTLTSIGYKAFDNCTALLQISIPDTVTYMGSYTFYGCTALTTVTFSSGMKSIPSSTFYGCTALASITIPEGVTNIDTEAFRECTSLVSVTLPSTLTKINYCSFYNCSALASVAIPEGVTTLGSSAFSGCKALAELSLPSTLTAIESLAFYECESLKSVDLPSGLSSIASQTFYNCSSLTGIIIPEMVTSIGDSAFYNCSALSSVTIPEGVTTIGYSSFANCTSLTSIELPESLISLGYQAFYGCTALTSITGGSKLTPDTIGYNAFYNNAWLKDGNAIFNGILFACTEEVSEGVLDLSELNITSLGTSLFSSNSLIKTVKFPSTLTYIGASAFSYCTNLSTLENVSNINYIGDNAFNNCTSLETFGTIANDAYVAASAFYGTPYLYNNGLKGSCGDDVEYELKFGASLTSTDAVLTLTGTGEVTSAPWSTYSNIIQKVIIGEGVTALCESAFSYYTVLETIEGGESLVSVPNESVYGTSWYNNLIGAAKLVQLGGVLVKYTGTETEITLPDTVKTVESYAFQNNTTITKVIFPTGIKRIGESAFYGCTALAEINLPEGLEEIGKYAFYNTAISAITIPSTVTELKDRTFANCSNLKEVEYSDSLVIARDAFWNSPYDDFYGTCGTDMKWKFNGKDTITITGSGDMSSPWWSSTTEIKENTTTVIFNGEITSIYSSVFDGMTKLTNVTIPETVTKIEGNAFRNTGITSINLPEGLTSLGMRAFANTKLTSVVIPSTVTEMSSYVFENCTELVSIEVYSTVFNQYILNGCTALKNITLNSEIISRQAFSGDTVLESFVIGPNVKTIEEYAFSGATGLKSITFAEGSTLETIKYNAFEGCTGLEEIHFPASLKTIEHNAFDGCTKLNKVTFQEGIESIGAYAFVNCPSLTEVSIPKSIVTIGEYAFHGYSELFADEEGGKEYYHYYGYAGDFLMKGYINTEAERYASVSAYNVTFEPLGGDISGCVLSLSASSYTYDGNAKTPTATLKSKYGLVTITPVSVTYSNNTNVGTATVRGTYIGSFYNSNGSYVTATFTIKAASTDSSSGSATTEEVEEAIKVLEELGLDPNAIKNAESDEVAYAYASEYAEILIAYGYSSSITAEDLVKAIRGTTTDSDSSSGTNNNTNNSTNNNTVTELADPSISKITNTSSGTKITWTAVTGATKYIVYRKKGSGTWTTVTTVTSTSYTDKKAKTNGTKYQYKVIAANDDGISSESSVVTNYYVSGVKLSKVKNVKTKKVNLQWKKNKKASGYQVKYVVGSKTVTKTYKKASTVKKTISNLKKNKTYKFYVRAYITKSGKKYYSAWSNMKKVKIKK